MIFFGGNFGLVTVTLFSVTLFSVTLIGSFVAGTIIFGPVVVLPTRLAIFCEIILCDVATDAIEGVSPLLFGADAGPVGTLMVPGGGACPFGRGTV